MLIEAVQTDVRHRAQLRHKFKEAATFFHTQVSTMPKGEREGGRGGLWIMNGQHSTTDTLLFGVVQSSGILLILRKRLADSFPVYRARSL